VFLNKQFFCQEKKALAFKWDRCCHLQLCLRLILFHRVLYAECREAYWYLSGLGHFLADEAVEQVVVVVGVTRRSKLNLHFGLKRSQTSDMNQAPSEIFGGSKYFLIRCRRKNWTFGRVGLETERARADGRTGGRRTGERLVRKILVRTGTEAAVKTPRFVHVIGWYSPNNLRQSYDRCFSGGGALLGEWSWLFTLAFSGQRAPYSKMALRLSQKVGRISSLVCMAGRYKAFYSWHLRLFIIKPGKYCQV